MSVSARDIPGTILWIAPFYNRSGYGVGARAMALALHRAGLRIRIMPVNEVEPGIDDCDMELLKSLEKTPPVPPFTQIVFHVPSENWLKLDLPGLEARILATTFDGLVQGSDPLPEWLDICRRMDRVWLTDGREREALIAWGIPKEQLEVIYWPHPWLDNPIIPKPIPELDGGGKRFRFLSIAIFQPRIRWNILIEAFLEEFNSEDEAELYLKVRYPSWHPLPEVPKLELFQLISDLRRKTGSKAPVIVDEELGSRLSLLKLIDSCNVYVSTDINNTAPLGEATVRERLVIVPEGLGYPDCIHIKTDLQERIKASQNDFSYKAHYQSMPKLSVEHVRSALRSAWNMSAEERKARCRKCLLSIPTSGQVLPRVISSLSEIWKRIR